MFSWVARRLLAGRSSRWHHLRRNSHGINITSQGCKHTRPRIPSSEVFVQIFLYEFVTGGGMSGCQSIPRSLLQEGRGMADALATDFVAAGFEVQRMIDTT